VSSGRQIHSERMVKGTRAPRTRGLVVYRHHILVRISHWLTIPLLLGLILSGMSIYWASPVCWRKAELSHSLQSRNVSVIEGISSQGGILRVPGKCAIS
jgi:hypothetical protein